MSSSFGPHRANICSRRSKKFCSRICYCDPKQEIIIAADASKSGIGACHACIVNLKAIAHASRTLAQFGAGYSQIEKRPSVGFYSNQIPPDDFEQKVQAANHPWTLAVRRKDYICIPQYVCNDGRRIFYATTSRLNMVQLHSLVMRMCSRGWSTITRNLTRISLLLLLLLEEDIQDEAVGILPITFYMILKKNNQVLCSAVSGPVKLAWKAIKSKQYRRSSILSVGIVKPWLLWKDVSWLPIVW